MSLVEILKNNESDYNVKNLQDFNLNSLRINHKVIGQGIKEINNWKRQAGDMDIVFDPPFPDSGVPIGMLGEPNKDEGLLHIYDVTTDPGRKPELLFSGNYNLIIPTYENIQEGPGQYKSLVNIATKLGPPSVEDLTITFNDIPVSVKDDKNPAPLIPDNIELSNYPNPFNPGTTINYKLKEPSPVTIHIYSTTPELVDEVFNGYQKAGEYEILWNGKSKDGIDLPSGVYLLNIITPGQHKTLKMLKLK